MEILSGAGSRYLRLPQGATGQRPTGAAEMLRMNTTARLIDYHDGANWEQVLGSPAVTFGALDSNGDVGNAATQVPRGTHRHELGAYTQVATVIDAQIIIRDNKVFMRKRCPTHGWFEGIISSDAQMYVDSVKFNKPGTIPLEFSTEVKDGCPLDCGLCPEHKQHMCLALIEVNSACNLNCPICFANAGVGFSLTMEQVEFMLDRFVETEGDPEVIQFSGGEPTIHPDLMDMIQAAKDRGIRQVMVNTNGVRIARDDEFLEALAKQNPVIYFQFDGLRRETYETIRGEDLLDLKLKALQRLAEKGIDAVLVAAIERGG